MSDAADRMLDKLREFAAGLDDEERALLAALVAPAVAQVHEGEVEGFGWSWDALPESLAAAIERRDLRISGW